ncbi:MAG TPA: SDR family oxidoreductase [Jatrophihabitans sp.]|jgi:NAD(P)-dependent dehydrogenase (short-subunit alcohol dehydrogenase family)|nr:SDR family oxidoreductase [Jatrophihabitans sp.]
MSTLLIVGAGPRLGGAIARRFGREGYDIALISEDEASVAALGQALQVDGITAGWAVADVRDDAELRAAASRFAEYTGGVDVVLHNVSIWRDATVLDLTPDQLLDDVRAGAACLLSVAQAVAPGMIAAGGGAILATGSAAADAPSPGAPTLGVQKAALRALVQAMSLDLGPQGIHCATVTINGLLESSEVFAPARIADVFYSVAVEARAAWRTVVPYPPG